MPTNAGNNSFEECKSKKRLTIKRNVCKYRVKGEAIASFAKLPAKRSAKAYVLVAAKYAGTVTAKGLKAAGVAAGRACKPIGKKLYPVADYVVLQNARKIREEFKEVRSGFAVAVSGLREAARDGKLAVVKTFGLLAKKAVCRHRKIFTTAIKTKCLQVPGQGRSDCKLCKAACEEIGEGICAGGGEIRRHGNRKGLESGGCRCGPGM